MRRWLLPALLALAPAACSAPSDCGQPGYRGKASDEAWLTFVDAEGRVVTDDAKAADISVPAEAEAFGIGSAAPTFTWTSPLMASNAPQRAPGPRRSREVPAWRRLSNLVIGEAWAHLPPVTGVVHLLKVTVPKTTCPVQVLTTETTWTPSSAEWQKLKAAPNETLTLEITSAYLRENRITEGPYRATKPRHFVVAQ